MKRNWHISCSVLGCKGSKASLHRVPSSGETTAKWLDFIFQGNVPGKISKNLRVCSKHFPQDCFTNRGQYDAGLASKLCLKDGAEPSVRHTDGESGDTGCSERNGVTEWLCPLCQKGQSDRSSLSRHLIEQHSVLPSSVDRLLDIAVQKQAASGGEKDRGAQKSSDAASSQLRPAGDVSSDPCQSSESTDTTQTLGEREMEEEKIMEQEGGEAEPELEEEGNPLTGAKKQNATENTEIPDASEKSVGKSNTRPFKCNACLESFSSRTALSVHDTKKRPYKCVLCQVFYSNAITLESHMRSVSHQTRCRNAGIAANSAVASGNLRGSTTSASNTAVTTSGSGTSQMVTSTNCAAPGTLMVTTAKEGEQIPTSSAPAASAFLALFASTPLTMSQSFLPSLFVTSTAAPQLVPQPQMVVPVILNGLQAQTQQLQENQQGQLLTRCVPFSGLSTAQQAPLAQGLNSLQKQWPSAGVSTNIQHCPEDKKPVIKREGQQESQDSGENVSDHMYKWSTNNIWTGKCEEEEDSKEFVQCPNIESKIKVENSEDYGDRTTDGGHPTNLLDQKIKIENSEDYGYGDSSSNQLDLEGDKAASLNLSPAGTEKSIHNNNLSPSPSVPSNSNLSPVHLNLTPAPQKSQSGTSPCGSLGTPKSSPSTNALTNNQTRLHCNTMGSIYPDLPVLSEFQSEVLSAFFESRSEADVASPPREDCEALGKEVGLSEVEVRRWLTQARHAKQRKSATELDHLAGFTRHSHSSDNDFDDEENSLIIAEGDDDAEASGSQAMDLSCTRGERKQRDLGRDGQGDSCLTSDSENEVYTSVIVSDEGRRKSPKSPVKDEAQRGVHGDKGSAVGKVLCSTADFLSDAEVECEDKEGEGSRRPQRTKRKRTF